MSVLRDRQRRSTAGTFHVRSGIISFGTSLANQGMGDVQLYRKTTNELALQAGDSLTIPGSATVGTILLVSGASTQTGNITCGGSITATSGIRTKEATGAVAISSLSNNGDIQVQECGGTPRILARIGGTTYFFDKTG